MFIVIIYYYICIAIIDSRHIYGKRLAFIPSMYESFSLYKSNIDFLYLILKGIKSINEQYNKDNDYIDKYKSVKLWCSADLGTCRIHPQFCTAWNFEVLGIEDIKIIVEDETPAWEKK